MNRKSLSLLGPMLLAASPLFAADWTTHRGNVERTGCIDGQPGPKTAKVLWVHKATEHYIASPVVANKSLLVSGLGAFNSSVLQSMSLDPAAKERIAWSKSAPYLKLPMVSSPVQAGDVLVFGDGMHQTSGAILHGLRADTGLALWQLAVPGDLVHLEGSPTFAEGKIYIGGGSAGVLCIDPSKITIDGKEVDPAGARKLLDERWKQLLAKYEVDKVKDPDFAMKPTEDSLPKSQPKLAWQQGQERWHVDASVTVAGGKVLVGSAFLEDEKLGDRALYALNAADGKEVWRAPLARNPWGGPTIAGDKVLVGCSNIRFDPKEIPSGSGEVVAFSLADGTELWKRAVVKGGVLSPVVAAGKLAVFTATDGKVRGLDIESKGTLKWTYDGKAPFFAAPAVAGDVAYAADLNGVVHAVNLANGTKLWTLDLGADSAVKAAGAAYGSPVVHGGRLYVATSNLDAPAGRNATVVVCIGEK